MLLLDTVGSNERVTKWLKLFLAIVSIGAIFLTLLLPFTSTDPVLGLRLLVANLIVIFICAVLFVSVQKGHADGAATFFIILVYLGATLPMFFVFQAVSAPTVYGYFVLIPLAGLLKGRRALVAAVAITVLTLGLALYLESTSVLVADYTPSLLDAFIMIILGIAINTSLLLSAL